MWQADSHSADQEIPKFPVVQGFTSPISVPSTVRLTNLVFSFTDFLVQFLSAFILAPMCATCLSPPVAITTLGDDYRPSFCVLLLRQPELNTFDALRVFARYSCHLSLRYASSVISLDTSVFRFNKTHSFTFP